VEFHKDVWFVIFLSNAHTVSFVARPRRFISV